MKDYRSRGPLVQRLSALPVNKENNLSEFDEHCGVSFYSLRRNWKYRVNKICEINTISVTLKSVVSFT